MKIIKYLALLVLSLNTCAASAGYILGNFHGFAKGIKTTSISTYGPKSWNLISTTTDAIETEVHFKFRLDERSLFSPDPSGISSSDWSIRLGGQPIYSDKWLISNYSNDQIQLGQDVEIGVLGWFNFKLDINVLEALNEWRGSINYESPFNGSYYSHIIPGPNSQNEVITETVNFDFTFNKGKLVRATEPSSIALLLIGLLFPMIMKKFRSH